jgi:alkaline phosphatase D
MISDDKSTRRSILRSTAMASAAFAFSRAARSDVRRSSAIHAPLDDAGVASGDPAADAVTLWTRLPDSVRRRLGIVDGDAPTVDWVITAHDAAGRGVRVGGRARVSAATDWTVRVRPTGLPSGARFRYRFALGDEWSSVGGEARTLPAATDALAQLRLAYGSCQYYGLGFFHVLAAVAKAQPDFFIHLGDTIYERVGERHTLVHVRNDPVGEALSLDDYRAKHRRNLTDAAYKEARRRTTWICVPDDHDLYNGWSGNDPAHVQRRRDASQAYREYMPVSSDPFAAREYRIGSLATLYALDERSARSGPVCLDRSVMGYSTDCAELVDPSRTMLGERQRAALIDDLKTSTTRWQVLLSSVMLMPQRVIARPVPEAQTADLISHSPFRTEQQEHVVARRKGVHALYGGLDGWDGFPVERAALFDELAHMGRGDTLVFTGDVHNLYSGFLEAGARKVGFEVSTGSISTVGIGDVVPFGAHRLVEMQIKAANPHFERLNLKDHMFVMCTLDADGVKFESHCVDTVREPMARVRVKDEIRVRRGTLDVA